MVRIIPVVAASYQAVMNSLFPNGLQCVLAAAGLVPLPTQPALSIPGIYPPGVIPGTLPLHSPLLALPQQYLDINKLLQIQLLQQQQQQQQQRYITHNFAFSNSSGYHPSTVPGDHSKSASPASPLSPSPLALCEDIKQEILKQLQPLAAAIKEECSNDSRKEEIEEKQEEDIMNRGVKRRSGEGLSWQDKRSRPDGGDKDASSPGGRDVQQLTGVLLTSHQYQQMTESISEFYEKNRQQQAQFEKKMKLRTALYAIVKGVFPYCGLYVVGSSMNGFGSSTSDMDMCLMLSHIQLDQKKEATEILRILLTALRKCTFLRDLILIKAKVPILKFMDRISNVECDLNINNSVGIRNTHLLNAYGQTDWRLSPLVLFIKYWARYHNINDAKEGTISSYSLGLMVIHFLQCGVQPPVLPCLQQMYPHKFNNSVDVRELNLNEKLPEYTSENTMSLGELFLGFLHYYNKTYNFNRDAISVRLGQRVSHDFVMRNGPEPGTQWKCLSIEEPFDMSNTARSVYDPNTFNRIMRVFRVSYGKLRVTGDVQSIIDKPV